MKIKKNITSKGVSMAYLLLPFALLISACSSSQSENVHTPTRSIVKPEKILIVYLSRTNNTKTVAEIIQNHVGGTLVALELEKPYPENYQAIVEQVVKENETGYLPPLKTRIDSIEKYDVVFCWLPYMGNEVAATNKSLLTSI